MQQMGYPKRYPIMHGYQDSFNLDINDYFKCHIIINGDGMGGVGYGIVG